jgi:hypothetical protein
MNSVTDNTFSKIINIEQIIFTICIGYISASIPNTKSNIHPLLLASILGILARKIIYGDFDEGHRWSIYDIYFAISTIFLSLVGAGISMVVK